jgi:hypothetical protein
VLMVNCEMVKSDPRGFGEFGDVHQSANIQSAPTIRQRSFHHTRVNATCSLELYPLPRTRRNAAECDRAT